MPCSVWNPLSPANLQAVRFWGRARRLGPVLALALADLEFTPETLEAFIERLLVCAELWPFKR